MRQIGSLFIKSTTHYGKSKIKIPYPRITSNLSPTDSIKLANELIRLHPDVAIEELELPYGNYITAAKT
jgi:hypothetical protein